MFDFTNTLGDIVKSQEDNITDISLKSMNPCELFYYMYGIPFKVNPIDNNGFYEITNISTAKCWLIDIFNNSDKVYHRKTLEIILYQYFQENKQSDLAYIKMPHLSCDTFIFDVYTNEYFTVLCCIQKNGMSGPYFIKCNNLPNFEGSNYYEVLNELPHTLNYIDYRKTFKLDNRNNYLQICNKLLYDTSFLFCNKNNKAYFIYNTACLSFINFYHPMYLTNYKNRLEILLGADFNTIDWLASNLCDVTLPVTKHVVINGKDTNITISDKVYDEVPSYVQKIYKSQLGINKNSKNIKYTMRAIVIDIK